MNITYTIDENNAVSIFDGINPEPFIYQPHYPDGSEFTTETAQAWAEEFIIEWTDKREKAEAAAALKESAKAKLTAGEPLTPEEVAILFP